MDYIPNEILLKIIGYLKNEDVPKLRLVNTRFNLLATPFVQKLFEVDFKKDSDIMKFVDMFENNSIVPFEKFGFGKLVTVEPLKQFCVQFGKNVKFWQNFVGDPSKLEFKSRQENSISKSAPILLEYCDNVEEINYLVVAEKKITKVIEIPTLRNLKTITITYLCCDNNKDVFPLLDHIFQNAPNLRNVSIENGGNVTFVASILHQLHKFNGTVHIKKLDIVLQLPVNEMDDLRNLVAISTQFTILELKLFILKSSNSDELPQTGEILSKWIGKLEPLRKLSLKHHDWRGFDRYEPFAPMSTPLRSLANLQCLMVDNLLRTTPVAPHTKFPVLTTLDYMNGGDEFIFAGCVFPNVKFAKIDSRSEEECEQWPLVLPNVEELYVLSKTLKGIFKFPKLKKLHVHVYMDPYLNKDDCKIPPYLIKDYCKRHRQHCWNNLTGYAQHISKKQICKFELETAKTSDSIDSFRNLSQLTHLKFFEENIKCWKAVIYASRTGQLRRLEKLVFSDEYFKQENEYHKELTKYHDSVLIADKYKLPPFLFSASEANEIDPDDEDFYYEI